MPTLKIDVNSWTQESITSLHTVSLPHAMIRILGVAMPPYQLCSH